MIKMIVSDMDGTLLPEGTADINPETFDVIRKVREKGILFVAASGRQYPSMIDVLEPVKKELILAADNGAYITCNGQDIAVDSIAPAMVEELIDYLRGDSNFQFVLSTTGGTYAEDIDDALADLMCDGYGCPVEMVEDTKTIPYPVTKVAAYCKDTEAIHLEPAMAERFGKKVYVVVSGVHWIDFIKPGVSKGNALEKLQEIYGITPEETMAFGDNNNDIPLLQRAKYSFAAPGATEGTRAVASEVLDGDVWDSVIRKIKEMVL